MDPRFSLSRQTPSSIEEHDSLLINYGRPPQERDRYWLHLTLFFITLVATVYAGAQNTGRLEIYVQYGYFAWLADGMRYAVPLLAFLTFHEFGHYFAARFSRVRTSLPYYIPFPFFFLPIFHIGTFGAVIRIREPIPTTRKLFDIGVWGPVAGFAVALVVLLYAFATLPPPEYILEVTMDGHQRVHEHVLEHGTFPEESPEELALYVGQTPLFWAVSQLFEGVPPMYEVYHYPMLFAAWLALFFTALNLLPVGQLDGGHILYALVGPKWHGRIARLFVLILLYSASVGFIEGTTELVEHVLDGNGLYVWLGLSLILLFFMNKLFKGYLPHVATALLGMVILTAAGPRFWPDIVDFGYSGWFFWCLLIMYIIKVDHPPVLHHESLTPGRRALGIISLIIFLLCFSIKPLYFV